jgi:hypothetical protein
MEEILNTKAVKEFLEQNFGTQGKLDPPTAKPIGIEITVVMIWNSMDFYIRKAEKLSGG